MVWYLTRRTVTRYCSCSVTPAQAGVQRAGWGPTALDSRLRGNDNRYGMPVRNISYVI